MHIPAEVTADLHGAANSRQQREASEVLQSGVVRNLEATGDRGKKGHGDVGKIAVADKRQIAAPSRSQVGCAERSEEVGVEAHGAVDSGQRRNAEARHVGHGHVGNPDKIREADFQVQAVGVDVQERRQVAQGRSVLDQAAVVVDVNGASSLNIKTVQAAQESVADNDAAGLGDTSRECEDGDGVQGDPVDGANRRQLRKGQRRQRSQVLQVESTRHALKAGAAQGGDELVVQQSQVTGDLCGATQINRRICACAEDDISGKGAAAGKLVEIGLGVDGERVLCTGGRR